jgi:lipoate-protein ligase A
MPGPSSPGSRAWHLWLDTTPRPGWQNMAIDQTLLEHSAAQGLAFLRLYRWEPFCLSFGRHEPAARRYGRDRVQALGVDVVRRPTGGRAVWHARELTYAVIVPDSFGSLPEAYQRIHHMLRDAVRRLGAPADLAPAPGRAPGPSDGACFASPVGGEIMVQGRKVVGSAQVRHEGAILQHGAMLLEDDQAMVHALAGTSLAEAPEAPLSALLGRPITFAEAADAVIEAAASWSEDWQVADPEALVRLAGRHEARYRSDDWTWER